MANPQLENGHLRVANEVWDSLFRCDLTGSEFAVVAVVIRRTWGWHKKDSEISIAEFCQCTKRPHSNVTRALKHLIELRILRHSAGGGRGNPSLWGFNKDWQNWAITVPCEGQINNKLSQNNYPNSGTVYIPKMGQFIVKNGTVSPCNLLPGLEQLPPKDIFKDNKDNIGAKAPSRTAKKHGRSPDAAYEIFCSEFAEHRGIAYRGTRGDFVQLAALRKACGNGNGIPVEWARAIHNYFATPQGRYTVADLCTRYDAFKQGPLDRFNKPVGAGTGKRQDVHQINSETLRELVEESHETG